MSSANRKIIIALLIVSVALLGALAISMLTSIGDNYSKSHNLLNDDDAQTEAIKQAEAWNPPSDKICTMALTEAVHAETGAEYTFPSGCLAPGWEPAN